MAPRPLPAELRLLLWVLAATCLAACGPTTEKPQELRVGLIVPTSGAWSGVEASHPLSAAKLLVKQANEAGGVPLGQDRVRVTLYVRDSQDSVDKSLDAARELINNYHVSALIGPYLSRNAIAVGAEAEQARVPMISPTSTHPATTRDRRWVFRVTVVDTFQGRAMARFARRDLHLDTAAVLYDASNEYSSGLAAIFRDAFAALGGRMAAFESYVTGEQDFTRQLSAIKASEAEALFLPNFAAELERQVPQARELGAARVFLGADSWATRRIMGNPAFQGGYFTSDALGAGDNPAAREFARDFSAEYGMEPSLATSLTRDAFALLFDAVGRAGSTQPEDIRRALAATERFPGITGMLAFHQGGDPEKALAVMRISGSRADVLQTLDGKP